MFNSMLRFLVIALAVATAASARAQNNSPAAAPANTSSVSSQSSDGARRISPEEARVALDNKTAILVDVRGEEQYKAGHIKGVMWIPWDQLLNRLSELPRDKMIVTYCSWPSEHTSAGAVLNLKKNGIENAAAVLGGYEALVNAGFPKETGLPKIKGSGNTKKQGT